MKRKRFQKTALQDLDIPRTMKGVLLRVVIAALLGTVCMVAVYLLPTQPIERHVAQSAPIFAEEGGHRVLYEQFTSTLDNRTDALMLLEAAYDIGGTTLQRAMIVPSGWVGTSSLDSLVEHYLNGAEFRASVPYSRYWHGYLLALKPLLMVFDYGQIRALNGVCQSALLVFVVILLIRKKLPRLIAPYVISVLMLTPTVLARSLEFSPCYYIFSAAVIAVLINGDRYREQPDALRRWVMLFAYFGIATPYFDYLTFPISTFGIPALFWLAGEREREPKLVLPRLAALLMAWGAGYVGMWASKWIIGSILTGTDMLQSAFGSIGVRSSHESVAATFACLGKNVTAFLRGPGTYAAAACLPVMAALAVWATHRRSASLRDVCRLALPYLLVALLPFLWYLGTTEHASAHWWFTCKSLVVSAFAVLSMFAELYIMEQKNL